MFAGAPHPAGAASAKGFQRTVLREWNTLRANLPSSIWVRAYETRCARCAGVVPLPHKPLTSCNTLRANLPSSIWVRAYETRCARCAGVVPLPSQTPNPLQHAARQPAQQHLGPRI